MSPMTRCFSPDGIPGPDVAAYYRRRVEGETGLIITEGVIVDHPSALGNAGLAENDIPFLHGEAALSGWRRVVEEVHAAGGVIFPQLWHMGAMREHGTGPFPDAPPMRPSGLWGPPGKPSSIDPAFIARVIAPTRPMTEEEIADTIAAYARSAANAKAVGFDGIAIHGAHGYLIDCFLWAETNHRKDFWGGDHVARTRFAVEVVKAIRAAIGEDMPISFRYSQWKQQDFKARLAETPKELEEILGPITAAGVDMYEASTRNFDIPEFSGSELGLAGWTQKLTGKPTMAVGKVGIVSSLFDKEAADASPQHSVDALIRRLDRREFDLAGVGRALLHDAAWARKVRQGDLLPAFDPRSMMALT